jgi:hypothetical protein
MSTPYSGYMGWGGEHYIAIGSAFDGPHDRAPRQLPGLPQDEDEVTETDDSNVRSQDD